MFELAYKQPATILSILVPAWPRLPLLLKMFELAYKQPATILSILVPA